MRGVWMSEVGMKKLSFLLTIVLSVHSSHAVSVGEPSADPSVEAEAATFSVHPEFSVNLFADETMGVPNPIAMHWDHRGRLWVLTTLTYAQREPGARANDTLVILEDQDGDGRADLSTVYADGLDMPMGFALGHGGVFLGVGPDLLFLEDTDGDDKADRREVLLTGFGVGDTHQNISNFTWGPDGHLYFCQGLHCYSLVETPWGIVRGDTAGFWRLNPLTLRLEPYCFPALASQNPCGVAFDASGSLFIKSNNREVIFATPGLISTTHPKNLEPLGVIGVTPGKSMGGEIVKSAHLPDWLQGHLLISGYYAHQISAFPLIKKGAGYAKVEPLELMVASHESFRPVEIRIGPDGAIYIADWFNPIIGHYQASLRHPDRDREHGRVWRMVAKNRSLLKRSDWSLPETIPVSSDPGLATITGMIRNSDPQSRLQGIVAAARLGGVEALTLILETLDSPDDDEFLAYAREQCVHALASDWIPEIKKGTANFARPEHLAYALTTLGGEEALGIARARLALEGASLETRRLLAGVIARDGTAQDMRDLLDFADLDATILEAMADSSQRRKLVAAEPFADQLSRLVHQENGSIQIAAIRLAGLWGLKEVAPEVAQWWADETRSEGLRAASAQAYAKLDRDNAVAPLLEALPNAQGPLAWAILDSLVEVAPQRAAAVVARILASISRSEDAQPWLIPFLGRKGAPGHLAEALRKVNVTPETAGHISAALSTAGRSDESLLAALQDAMGTAAGARVYSPEFVAALTQEVREKGVAAAGEEIYHRIQLSCTACHQLKGAGGVIGPPLDTVGAGLSLDILIESVLWPDRQLKEGYFGVVVTTKGGNVFSGYIQSDEKEQLAIRDTATGVVQSIPRVEILKVEKIGTLMPVGLTASLSGEELRDLIAFLASLKG
jgi:putative heme-binding domain-containing protein